MVKKKDVLELFKRGYNARQIMEQLDVSRTYIYTVGKDNEEAIDKGMEENSELIVDLFWQGWTVFDILEEYNFAEGWVGTIKANWLKDSGMVVYAEVPPEVLKMAREGIAKMSQ